MVALEALLPEDEQTRAEAELAVSGKGRLLHLDRCDESVVRSLIEKHLRYTGSPVALALLDNWENERARFVKVFPHEYKRVLGVARVDSFYVSPINTSPLMATEQVQHG